MCFPVRRTGEASLDSRPQGLLTNLNEPPHPESSRTPIGKNAWSKGERVARLVDKQPSCKAMRCCYYSMFVLANSKHVGPLLECRFSQRDRKSVV